MVAQSTAYDREIFYTHLFLESLNSLLLLNKCVYRIIVFNNDGDPNHSSVSLYVTLYYSFLKSRIVLLQYCNLENIVLHRLLFKIHIIFFN